jgi:MarR family transcriptional regulator, transcriptional regulator for hemolysin
MINKPLLGVRSTSFASGEPTLDQLLAAPIVQQLMRRDGVDEATIRHLLQETAAARLASSAEDDLKADDPRSIAQLLHQTARLWCSRYDREVRAQLPGMTGARCTVLIYLAQHEGVNQAALAKMLEIRPITLGRLIDRLEADGFVTRAPASDDRPAHMLALTAKALPIVEYIYVLTKRIYDDLLRGISKAEDRQVVEAGAPTGDALSGPSTRSQPTDALNEAPGRAENTVGRPVLRRAKSWSRP